MYVAHKFVLYHSMAAAREIGNIKEMALRQKFELFIFQKAPQRLLAFMTHIETFIQKVREKTLCSPTKGENLFSSFFDVS